MPSFRSSHGPHTCGSMSSSSSDNFVHALKKVLPTCTARHSFLPFAFLVLARAMPTRGCNGSPTTWLQGQPDHLAGNRTRCLLLKVTFASAVTAVATAFCHGSTVLDRYALCSKQKLRGAATFLLSPPSSACRFPSNRSSQFFPCASLTLCSLPFVLEVVPRLLFNCCVRGGQ